MDLKRIVSVGIELNIFVSLMVLDHHKINHQLFDFQFLSLTNIRPFSIDTLNEFYQFAGPLLIHSPVKVTFSFLHSAESNSSGLHMDQKLLVFHS